MSSGLFFRRKRLTFRQVLDLVRSGQPLPGKDRMPKVDVRIRSAEGYVGGPATRFPAPCRGTFIRHTDGSEGWFE